MRAKEFIKEGVDTSPADVQQNHPEIYNFISKITGPYAPEKAKVNSFDLGNKHFIVLKMGPSAGLDNTRAVMKSKGIGFDNRSENELIGEHNDLRFTIKQDKIGPGNNVQTWEFEMPNAVQEADMNSGYPGDLTSTPDELIAQYNQENMMAGGSEASLTGPDTVTVQSLDDWEDMFIGSTAEFEQWMNSMSEAEQVKWNYVCPKGHHTPYEGPGAPEFIIRPCPECGLKAKATKQQAVQEADPVLTPQEEAQGWIVKNGTKMKIGKARPFRAGDMNTDPSDDEVRGWSRGSSRSNYDDGSRGLSARDRNR